MIESGWVQLPGTLEPGRHFLQGNEACAEGAIAAGCNFYAGYPITPASEIMHHICNRFASMPNRVFMQMEDELASIASCIGASWAGAKSMTATSGPGLSLMLENIGYAIITETPCVIVDVQRGGPSTGQATRPAQGDVMQARWGAHGDYESIVLAPWSVQEMYSETIRAFNLSEQFRLPVIVLADEAVGHLRENIEIPPETRVFNRITATDAHPFAGSGIPPMPAIGTGHKLLITGSTHDSRGYRRTSSPEAQSELIEHLSSKISLNLGAIVETEVHPCEDDITDLLVIAYGFTARSALRAIWMARRDGVRAGLLRLKTIWPFPEKTVRELASRTKRVLVPEMNRGQVLREVQRLAPTARGYNRTSGQVITPNELAEAIREVAI